MEFIALVIAIVAFIFARKASNRSHEFNARLALLEASLAGGMRPSVLPADAPVRAADCARNNNETRTAGADTAAASDSCATLSRSDGHLRPFDIGSIRCTDRTKS